MNIIQQYSVNNDCYKKNVNKADSRYTTFQKRGPQGLMLHSVGCSQPSAKVFANSWNQPGKEVAVHAVLQADGTVYQCLPWNYRGWHAGGDANNTHVGVEMTEPDCIKYTTGASFTCSDKSAAQTQVKGTYETAVQLFAQLCAQYGLNPLTDIISHKEGCAKGIASNHGDPEHLWTGLNMGYTMDTFRKAVKAAMDGNTSTTTSSTDDAQMYRVRKSWAEAKSQIGAYRSLENAKAACREGYTVYDKDGNAVYSNAATSYLVKITAGVLNVRKGPGTGYGISTTVKKNEVYTIVGESAGTGSTKGWGKLKSGAGWISLDYAAKLNEA